MPGSRADNPERFEVQTVRHLLLVFALLIALWSLLAPQARAQAPEGVVDDESGERTAEPPSRKDDPFLAELKVHRADALARIRSPEAALPLYRAYALKDRLPDLVPLIRMLETVRWRATDPSVRGLAGYMLGAVERTRGRMHRADAHFERVGVIDRWRVIGPFDNEGKRGCAVAFPPESGVELEASHDGKVRPVRWRELPTRSFNGFIDLGGLLRPTNEVVAYAHTVIDSATEQRAVIHLGASGASRIWLNGQRAFADDTYHPVRIDQHLVEVTLRKGPNQLLLKVCHDTGPFGFFVRVTSPKGDALRGISVSTPESLPAPTRGPGPAPKVLPSLADHFRRRALANPKDASVRADYAEILHYTRNFEAREKRDFAEAVAASDLDPKNVRAALLAAKSAGDDQNVHRQYLEKALAAEPHHPEATALLAAHHLSRQYPRRALDLLVPARQKWPRYYPLALLEARALDEMGLTARSFKLVESLTREFPRRFEITREAARTARRQDRIRDAVALYRVALSLRFDDHESRRALAGLLADLGDVQGALKEQRELIAIDPFNAWLWLRAGELAAANDLPREAGEAFARARELLPDEAGVHEREGRALARMKDDAAALVAFERALALKPQNVQLKETLKALRGTTRGFGEDLAWDVRKLIAENPPTENDDAVVLADLSATKVFPSGMASRFRQKVVRAQTPRGVEAERTQWITYAPDRQDIKLLRARVIKPDGSIIESHTSSERSLSDEGSRLYYDARARIIGFPALAPGDVLELAYRLDDTANDNLLSDYFGDIELIQGTAPKAHFDYYLSMPKGRTIYSNDVPLQGLTHTQSDQADGSRLHHWSARNVPRFVPEPGMPGAAEVLPTLHVSTYEDWESVGRYYWGLIRDQLTITDEVKATALELAKGLPRGDELAIVNAVYEFVVSRTRYIGLEFGIHGFKPYRVDQVLARRFGDCKDKASLMHALLKVHGIDSKLVLLRMRRMGKLDEHPASLSAFNHAILYVPKFDLWLDGTAEFHGLRELPSEDRQALVLVVEPDGHSRIGLTPEAKASDNATRSVFEVVLSELGDAVITGHTTVSGVSAPQYRRAYQAPATRKQTFEQAWSRTFPGLSVKSLEVSDLTRLDRDVELRFVMEAPRFAHAEDGSLVFSPFGQSRSYVESYAALSTRRQELVLKHPWSNQFTYRYALPPGFTPGELPSDLDVKSPFGQVRLRYRVEEGALVIDGQVSLELTRISPADYPAFRNFLSEIDRGFQRRVRLEPSLKLPPRAQHHAPESADARPQN